MLLCTVSCEAVFNTHPAVFRSALVGIELKGETTPVLYLELEQGHRWSAGLEDELRAMGQAHAHTAVIERFLPHSGFPVDVRHNAKIFREKLRAQASREVSS